MAHIREIINSRDISVRFILGVLGFFKTTRSFPKIPEEVRSLPKTSEVCRRRSFHLLFTSKIRDREEGIVIYSFYTWFSFLTWVWVNIFLEIVSRKTATTHIFQSGVRNWPTSVSRHEIEVFNPQVWELAGIAWLTVKNALVNLPIRLKRNLKCISGYFVGPLRYIHISSRTRTSAQFCRCYCLTDQA